MGFSATLLSMDPNASFPKTLLTEGNPPAELIAPPHVPETFAEKRFTFTGSGAEYFGIWLVNLILTIVTFGIYSAWAKVRRLQYFYSNTNVAKANFNFHGTPMAIFKGRVVALVLLGIYNFAATLSDKLLAITVVALAAIMPWLIRRGLIFRARNSSYRSIRFRFFGTNGAAYRTFIIWGIALVVSLGLATPAVAQRLRAYQFNHLALGTTPFRFTATIRQFYSLWGRTSLLWLAAFFGIGIIGGGALAMMGGWEAAAPAFAVAAILAFWLTRAHYLAGIQNLVWNNMTLGPHRFRSEARVAPLFRIMMKNALFTVFTLGLYRPYAVVNVMKYRAETMVLLPGAHVDEFLAQAERDASAVGAETADLFDLEISL
jgi:uncharacterized membrane protein YjgN (DUF898 family)